MNRSLLNQTCESSWATVPACVKSSDTVAIRVSLSYVPMYASPSSVPETSSILIGPFPGSWRPMSSSSSEIEFDASSWTAVIQALSPGQPSISMGRPLPDAIDWWTRPASFLAVMPAYHEAGSATLPDV